VKLVRVLIATVAALTAAVAVQMATSSAARCRLHRLLGCQHRLRASRSLNDKEPNGVRQGFRLL
jgi:hypothetical protein